MAQLIFCEKPGCGGNARQKALLLASSHAVEARSLLAEPWTAAELLRYFGPRPVEQWFNMSSPRVKSGEIEPKRLSSAVELMLADPVLIRRPLTRVGERCEVGFDMALVEAWIGLAGRVSRSRTAAFVRRPARRNRKRRRLAHSGVDVFAQVCKASPELRKIKPAFGDVSRAPMLTPELARRLLDLACAARRHPPAELCARGGLRRKGAMRSFVRTRRMCEWEDFAARQAFARAKLADPDGELMPPFQLLSEPGVTAVEQRACSENWMRRRRWPAFGHRGGA